MGLTTRVNMSLLPEQTLRSLALPIPELNGKQLIPSGNWVW